jgi:hypothetical protein
MLGLMAAVGMMVFLGGMLLTAILSLAIGFVYPAMAANFARRGTFGACFDLGEMMAFIRRNFSNYLMVWLTSILVGVLFVVVYTFLSFIPCIGTLLMIPASVSAAFFIYMVNGHALGQALALDPGPTLAPPQEPPAIAAGTAG